MPFFSIGGIQIEFVNQWPHLRYLITDSLDDNNDIAVRRNTCCSSFYVSVLWDLESPAIHDVCIAWRKGPRRVWEVAFTVTCYL